MTAHPNAGEPPVGWSPLVRDNVAGPVPHPLTEAEEEAVCGLLDVLRPRPATVTIGSSRDDVSRAAAERLAIAWRERGGTVLDILDWPETAASWLRQARRFATGPPDAWIVTGAAAGWVQMGRRLALSTEWDPARTVATSSLATNALIARGGTGTFDHLRGAHPDGTTWEVIRTLIVDRPAPPTRPLPRSDAP